MIINKLPENWKKVSLKYLLQDDGIKIGPFGSSIKLDTLVEDGIKIYGQGNIINDDFELGDRHIDENTFEEKFKQYEILNGDILITMMGTTGKSKIFKSSYKRGILDSHLIRLRLDNLLIQSIFFLRSLQDAYYIIRQIRLNSKGSIMEGLNSKIIKDLIIYLPPIEDQKLISKYLDHKIQKIDSLIGKIKEKIELLKEQKTVLINQYVTKGLDPNVEMKGSGVDWIGEIPKHWNIIKFKYITSLMTCGHAATPEYVDDGVLFLSAQNIKNGKLEITKYKKIKHELHSLLSKRNKIKKGDLLQVRVGGASTIGETCIVDIDIDFSIYVSLSHIKLNEICDEKYIKFLCNSSRFREACSVEMKKGGGVANLNVSDLERYKISIPPKKEQECIANVLEKETDIIEKILEKFKIKIDLLKEYRQSLISSVVTGEIRITEDMI